MNSKHVFVEQLKAQLDEWDEDLAQLETQARATQEEVKIAYAERLAFLREQRDEAERKLEHVQQAADVAWDDLKAGAEDAWASIKKAYLKARLEFKD